MALASNDLSVVLLQVAADYLRKPSNFLEKKSSVAVQNAALFGKILSVLEAYVRAPDEKLAIDTLKDNLSPLIQGSPLEKCTSLAKELKLDIHNDSCVCYKHFPSLAEVRWRVDVTISSSVLSRVLEPNLIMELELSDGRKVTFELSVPKFHKLRFTVASLLKEMDHINNRLSAISI